MWKGAASRRGGGFVYGNTPGDNGNVPEDCAVESFCQTESIKVKKKIKLRGKKDRFRVSAMNQHVPSTPESFILLSFFILSI